MKVKKLVAVVLAVALTMSGMVALGHGEELPAPRTETIFPGVTKIVYAGETFVFTTTVKLSATFGFAAVNQISIKVKTASPAQEMGGHVGSPVVRIYWEDGDEYLYDGPPPDGEWTGLVQTEGGFTER